MFLGFTVFGFKPYYNWNTFNTVMLEGGKDISEGVLNLIITGIPSIPKWQQKRNERIEKSFKPYYNWNTFNTEDLATNSSLNASF